MTDSNCLIKKPRCGLQAGNPVCAKCGLDTRVGGYTSQQAGEEARSKALATWQTADHKEQAQLSELEQRKAQEAKRHAEKERLENLERKEAEEAAQRLAQEKAEAEAAERNEQERKNPEALVEQPSNEKQANGSSWLPRVASFVAVVVVLAGIRVYRQTEERNSQEVAQRTEAAMATMSTEDVLAALAPNKTQAPKQAQTAAPICNDCPDMVVVPAGSFQMGGSDSEAGSDEKPVHSVSVKSFAIGKYEVTQGQWRAVMGGNPSYYAKCGDNCPVERVSWNDIQSYIQKLNQKTGQQYRLPSEAEWEYACRGGQQQKYCGSDNVGNVAWYDENSAGTTHPVGQKAPNRYGLYDMSGNAWEWVQDRYNKSYEGAPTDGSAREVGTVERVLRGGSWFDSARYSRAAIRDINSPVNRLDYVGFRLARTVP